MIFDKKTIKFDHIQRVLVLNFLFEFMNLSMYCQTFSIGYQCNLCIFNICLLTLVSYWLFWLSYFSQHNHLLRGQSLRFRNLILVFDFFSKKAQIINFSRADFDEEYEEIKGTGTSAEIDDILITTHEFFSSKFCEYFNRFIAQNKFTSYICFSVFIFPIISFTL